MPAPPQQHPTWQGGLSSYNPSWREKVAYTLAEGFGGLGNTRAGNRRARYLTNVLEMIPFVGGAPSVDDAARSAERGDYLGAGFDLAMAGLPGPPIKGMNRLHTGWTFKDVKHPHAELERGEWSRVAQADKGLPEVELPIRSMYASQETVNADFAAAAKKRDDLPLVIKKNGQFFLQDGHHRITALAADGKQTAKVRLVDLDGTTQTEFPLLQGGW